VASRASAMTEDISFMVVNSGGGVSPYDEELYSYEVILRHNGASDTEIAEAMKLVKKYLEYLSSGNGREEIVQIIESVREKNWYQFVAIDRILVSEEIRPRWSWVANYNPMTDIEKMRFPILLLFGEKDTENPTSLAVSKWEEGLMNANNDAFTIKVFPGANHGLRMGDHHGYVSGQGWHRFAEGSIELQLNWLTHHVVK